MTIDLAAILASSKKVTKDWGWEAWAVNDPLYCLKFLKLDAGYQCSLHMHPRKSETFIIVEGRVRLEVNDFTHYLSAGEKFKIEPGIYHRFSSTEGALIAEVSSFHSDEDVVRKEPSRKMS